MDNQPETNSIPGCLLRVYWMILGNLALFICAAVIANRRVGTLIEFSPADAVFWAFALTTGFARFADARWLRGQTSMGKPATMKDIVRYEAILAGIVIVMWILAHVIANARS